ARAYFNSYTVAPDMMAALRSPVTMVAAADDPVIPVVDFAPFHNLNPHLALYIQAYGGHTGFIDIFPIRYWTCQAILAILEN
ncbi:MAG: hypothetical protein GY869_21950, partial [Planctomycetes bacterium]|nr:hypothetical protein [Planctomycetota bacterium]